MQNLIIIATNFRFLLVFFTCEEKYMVNKGSGFSNEPISILKGNEPFLFLT